MPTYICSAAAGRLTTVQKTEIVRTITAIHHEETGASRYLDQVIFYDLAPDSHYVAGQPAPADQIWVRGDIRGGRTNEQKSPGVGGRPQHPLRDVRRLSGLPHKKPQYMKRRSEFPTPQGREFGA